jgi:hypothetical protein
MKACIAILLIALSGCMKATEFTGSAHVEQGRAGCERKCAGQGLAMTGMVYMGEYSSACMCEVPGAATAGGSATSAAAGGAASGVAMQMRRVQEQQRAAAQQQALK